MKVSTEACILGAWPHFANPKQILDIGTGTGLLSLMLAQNFDCPIDAIEIEENAALQAKENFMDSPWDDKLQLIYSDIEMFRQFNTNKYDLIVSNPPFFTNGLKSKNKENNQAKHDDSLPKKLLAESIKDLLSKNGIAFVLFPEKEANDFIAQCKKLKLKTKESLIIKNRSESQILRKIIAVGNTSEIGTEELIIRYENGEYTELFKDLLSPFYLNL